MDNRYQILVTLWSLVKEIPQPTQYQCQPRQLILLSAFDWATIYSHLLSLQNEGLVTIVQADTLQFSITQKGMDEAVSLAGAAVQNLLK
jgi:predicted transcriptional regulator